MRAPKIAASPPLYRRSYVNASVLICKIIVSAGSDIPDLRNQDHLILLLLYLIDFPD